MLKRIYIITIDFYTDEKDNYGGIGTFIYHLLGTLSKLNNMQIKIITIGLKGQAGKLFIQDNIYIRRIFTKLSKNKRNWIDLNKNAKIYSKVCFNFNKRVSKYFQSKLKEVSDIIDNSVIYLQGTECGDLAHFFKKEGFRVISNVHSLTTQRLLALLFPLSYKSEYLKSRTIYFFKILFRHFKISETFLTRIIVLTIKLRIGKLILPSYQYFRREYNLLYYSDDLIVPSQGLKNYLLTHYSSFIPELNNKTHVIHWGVDKDLFTLVSRQDICSLRSRYNISSDDFVILSLCRIDIQKGLEYLINALILMEESNVSFTDRIVLFIIGTPCRANLGYYNKLKQLAKRVKKCRYYFIDNIYGKEKAIFYKLASVFVLPSIFEPFGLTLLESMFYSTAVIASSTDGPNDIIKDNFGILVRYNNPYYRSRFIKEAIKKIYFSNYKRMGIEAKKESEKYNIEYTVNKIFEVFNK